MDATDNGSDTKTKTAPRRTSTASDPAPGEAGPVSIRGDRALDIIGDQRVVVTEEEVSSMRNE